MEKVREADPRRWKALGVLCLVQFMLILDMTVVNVALPHMQRDLGFTNSGLAWVVNGYVLSASRRSASGVGSQDSAAPRAS